MVTKEQFLEWRSHPVTIEVYAEIRGAVQDLKDQLSSGSTLSPQADTTHGLTNKMVGQIFGLSQLLDLTYEDDDEDDVNIFI